MMFQSLITMIRILTLFVFSSLLKAILCDEGDITTPVIQTPSGPLRGIGQRLPGGYEIVYEFRNIPYAKPPIDQLRFKNPQPVEPWSDTLDATEFGPSCIQHISEMTKKLIPNPGVSEDCLSLNVYVPRVISPDNRKAVMVYIHGGAFINGQAMMYDSKYMSFHGDVIIVTINYRLGFLGFMSLGDPIMPGNYGIRDQIMALKWINKHIKSFGGDPDLVTVFGQSAGGMSASLLSLMPENKGLFRRVIAQSGVANSKFAVFDKNIALKNGRKFGRKLGCPISKDNENELQKTFDCFMKIPVDIILAHSDRNEYREPESIRIHVGLSPVVDGDLIPNHPEHLISNPNTEAYKFYRSIDLISGITSTEGSLLLFYITTENQHKLGFNVTYGIPGRVSCDVIGQSIADDFYNKNTNMAKNICNKYGQINDLNTQSMNAANLFGDFIFLAPAAINLERHASGNHDAKHYQYLFSRPMLIPIHGLFPKWFSGSGHGADVVNMFMIHRAEYFTNKSVPQYEIEVAEVMQAYWTNFAKTGNPNSQGLPNWPEYTVKEKKYIDLDLNVKVKSKMFIDRTQFWLKEIPKMEKTGT